MSHDLPLIVLAAVVVAGGGLLFVRFLARPATPALPYRRQERLLTAAERSFYQVLRAAAGERPIFAKVRLADLVWLPRETENRQAHLNRVTAKHIDFVLCDPDTLAPLLAIELDDSSHQMQERRQRDLFVDAVLHAAGLPLLRVPARRSYDASELAGLVRRAIDGVPVRSHRGSK